MAQCAVSIHSGTDWTLQKVQRAKFMNMVQPEQAVVVRWREQPSEEGLKGSFTLLVESEKVATFTAEFSSQEPDDE